MWWLIGALIFSIIATYFYRKHYVPFIRGVFKKYPFILVVLFMSSIIFTIVIIVTLLYVMLGELRSPNPSLFSLLIDVIIGALAIYGVWRAKKRMEDAQKKNKSGYRKLTH